MVSFVFVFCCCKGTAIQNQRIFLFFSQPNTGHSYPPKTYIVDLMHEPGTLISVESPEADSYKRL